MSCQLSKCSEMGGQWRKRPYFVDDVPVEDDLID